MKNKSTDKGSTGGPVLPSPSHPPQEDPGQAYPTREAKVTMVFNLGVSLSTQQRVSDFLDQTTPFDIQWRTDSKTLDIFPPRPSDMEEGADNLNSLYESIQLLCALLNRGPETAVVAKTDVYQEDPEPYLDAILRRDFRAVYFVHQRVLSLFIDVTYKSGTLIAERFDIEFMEDDEWSAVTLDNGEVWDVHLLIEDGCVEVSVYPVKDGESLTSISTPLILTIHSRRTR